MNSPAIAITVGNIFLSFAFILQVQKGVVYRFFGLMYVKRLLGHFRVALNFIMKVSGLKCRGFQKVVIEYPSGGKCTNVYFLSVIEHEILSQCLKNCEFSEAYQQRSYILWPTLSETF